MLQPPFEDIADLHEYVFQYLLKMHEEDNTFMFTLRQPHHFINTKTQHWFYGENETSLYFSCWDSIKNGTILYFEVDMKGDFYVYYSTPKNVFTPILPALDKIGQEIYEALGKNSSSILFSSSFKVEIGALADKAGFKYIVELLEDIIAGKIPPIKPKEFNRRLSYILQKRKEEKKLKDLTLTHLYVKNIGHFNALAIDFHRRMTCISGENGSGKSTILRAIGLGLLGDADSDFKKAKSLFRIKGQFEGIEEYEEKGEMELSYRSNDAIYSNHFDFSCENGEVIIKKQAEFAHIHNRYEFPILILGFPQKQAPQNGTDELAISLKSTTKDIRKLVYDEPDNRFSSFEKWILKLYGAANEAKVAGNESPKELKIIEQIFEIISLVTGTSVTFQMASAYTEKVWVCTDDAPNGIPLSMVSQGYSNVFGWIGYFMKRLSEVNPKAADFTQCAAIVILDEIDTYLHPNWQENILRVMVDKFPNVQFIVSTHSLFVYTSIPNHLLSVYHLEKENGEIVCTKITENLYGADRNEGARSIGATVRYAKPLQKIENLMNLIYKNQIPAAEKALNEDFSDMNPRDTELVKAKALLDAKKRLLKI